ncbi:MAG TPA: gluconate 2-dehydrogenase subunit 3 family protein [Candidatus Limnocylindrales bacterium]|jgi:hypothetical protein|nr:gluconate 2-dehydrogenase subunit 3 family protein [Candidatus Limnocylindrales bacterium]
MTAPRRLGARHKATVARIVESITPTFPPLDSGKRTVVFADVTRFVASQIEALPDFLRPPYKMALSGFEWLAVVRWGRPFTALDAARQAAWIALWSDSPVGAMRNFVKLIRGCALLAYYDHPLLLEALEAEAGGEGSRESIGEPA